MQIDGNQDDIELVPHPNSDSYEEISNYIPTAIFSLYEVYSYKHAAAIIKSSFTVEFEEIQSKRFGKHIFLM